MASRTNRFPMLANFKHTFYPWYCLNKVKWASFFLHAIKLPLCVLNVGTNANGGFR